jgi:hypothetical protein
LSTGSIEESSNISVSSVKIYLHGRSASMLRKESSRGCAIDALERADEHCGTPLRNVRVSNDRFNHECSDPRFVFRAP